MVSCSITRQALNLGDPDPVTGWYAKSYTSSTIKGLIRPKGQVFSLGGMGYYTRYDVTGFIPDVVVEGDVLGDANNTSYTVESAAEEWVGDGFSHYVCNLVKTTPFVYVPITSGTMPTNQDARYRTKLFVDTYFDETRLSPIPTVHMEYANAPYPIKRTFYEKGNTVVITVDTPESTPLPNHRHETYAYIERVPITIFTIDTPLQSGTDMRWKCESELRRVVETYFGGTLGALRRFNRVTDNERDMGGWKLYSVKYILEYKRVNPNYLPTFPAFGYGTGWNYDGDRLSGFVEGTWTVSGAGATQTTDGDYLTLARAGADASTVHANNLLLSTTVYPYLRYRYKCSNANIIPQIVVTFSSGSQTITLPNTQILTAGTVTLTPAKTVNKVALQATTADGAVIWDFTEIYAGDYTEPNCVKLTPPETLNDVNIKMPYWLGYRTQIQGSEGRKITMTCDLDVECANLTWMRPQTLGSKTDVINTEVFEQIHHEEATGAAPWHWLNYGKGAFKARLTSITPNFEADNTVTLEWTERRLSSAGNANESYRTRSSLDQVT